MFLGFDSSTQSLSALVIDPSEGKTVAEASVNFGNDLPQYGSPSGFIPGGKHGEVHADPMMWLEALDLLLGKLSAQTDLAKVTAIAGSGQQHGSVYLNSSFNAALADLRS
ncbi:MAG: carbohydrate kinase, partial [Akkermansiaceae bacterium]|nr:carbohydrate kinase [Akkermansiaceae bacterium]